MAEAKAHGLSPREVESLQLAADGLQSPDIAKLWGYKTVSDNKSPGAAHVRKLWKQANEQTNTAAAKALRLTAQDNIDLGIVDHVIPEPVGGAHRDVLGTAAALDTTTSQLQSTFESKDISDSALASTGGNRRDFPNGGIIPDAGAPRQS